MRFKIKRLTQIDGEPTFKKLQMLKEELASNTLTIKVCFGGGKQGWLGLVYSNAKFRIKFGGIDWVVPTLQEVYPIFQLNATNNEKKATISEFILNKYIILVVQAIEELLKNYLIEAIDKDYIIELQEGHLGYSGQSLCKILDHLHNEYAPMDNLVYKGLMERFWSPPYMYLPIDKYYQKQEECQLISLDSKDPITNKGMVIQLTTHLAEIGLINKQVTKFKKQADPTKKTWAKAKKWMRSAIKDLHNKAKLEGSGKNFQANVTTGKHTAQD